MGPDLKGVTDRRELTWLIEYLIQPDVLRARNDPLAVALDNQYKGVSMPNLRLSETDAEDVIAYIRAQEALIDKREAAGEPAGSGHEHHGRHGRTEDQKGHEGYEGH